MANPLELLCFVHFRLLSLPSASFSFLIINEIIRMKAREKLSYFILVFPLCMRSVGEKLLDQLHISYSHNDLYLFFSRNYMGLAKADDFPVNV